MNNSIKIARELVKIAKNLVAADNGVHDAYEFKACGVIVFRRDVYKSDFPMGRGSDKRYVWSTSKKNEEYFTPEECVVVSIKNMHQDERAKLIANKQRFEEIGMDDNMKLSQQRKVNLSFNALFVGDYTEKRLNDTLALITELFGENPM